MNPPKNTPALTDEELIERLAKFMGWVKKVESDTWWCWTNDGKHMVARGVNEVGGSDLRWNPLTDWNHWREVEEKIMEDEKLFTECVWTIGRSGMNARPVSMEVCAADLRTRALALLDAMAALSSSPHE